MGFWVAMTMNGSGSGRVFRFNSGKEQLTGDGAPGMTRALLLDAVLAHLEQREDRARASSALKVKLGETGRYVSQQAVQLHGGIGMSDELAVGHHFKGLLLLNTLFGDPDYHLDRYIALS